MWSPRKLEQTCPRASLVGSVQEIILREIQADREISTSVCVADRPDVRRVIILTMPAICDHRIITPMSFTTKHATRSKETVRIRVDVSAVFQIAQ